MKSFFRLCFRHKNTIFSELIYYGGTLSSLIYSYSIRPAKFKSSGFDLVVNFILPSDEFSAKTEL
jgi:hypothetical protein